MTAPDLSENSQAGSQLAGYLAEDESVDNRWKNCGKPVDDSVEKPVEFHQISLGQSCEKPGYVSVQNAVNNPCVWNGQAVNGHCKPLEQRLQFGP